MDHVLLYGQRTCVRKGCLNPLCHTTQPYPHLKSRVPHAPRFWQPAPGSTRRDRLSAGPRRDR
eukprot:353732-Chlamydomonas_euryale.AAC.1